MSHVSFAPAESRRQARRLVEATRRTALPKPISRSRSRSTIRNSAHEQRIGEQLHQLFHKQAASGALANAQVVDASISATVSSARASASAAISTSSGARAGTHGDGNSSLQHAASAVAGARAAINDAKVAALREPEHGDLADLVQLDQQAANAQGAIVVNLLV